MIENTTTKTIQSATIVFDNRPVINTYASIESDGSYNINYNVIDATAYFDNEIAAAKDMTAFMTSVRKAAKTQRLVWLAAQPVEPESPGDGEEVD